MDVLHMSHSDDPLMVRSSKVLPTTDVTCRFPERCAQLLFVVRTIVVSSGLTIRVASGFS
jgi:hypothetical protein